MHPRNRFRGGYDFRELVKAHPALAAFVRPNPYGDTSVDFSNPGAIKELNHALLRHAYGIGFWDLPPGSLCPPVPGRSDYIHVLADLLAAGGPIPRGRAVRILDIGVGASGIYPIIGASEHGWSFVGSEADPRALRWVLGLIARNPSLTDLVECRLQPNPEHCFAGVVRPGEVFDASICNPPFYSSAAEAQASNQRKNRNLDGAGPGTRVRNFGGQPGELWCRGGEVEFVGRMIDESALFRDQCRWFTTLISKSEHLPQLRRRLRTRGAVETKTLEISHGQKKSRILAWSY